MGEERGWVGEGAKLVGFITILRVIFGRYLPVPETI